MAGAVSTLDSKLAAALAEAVNKADFPPWLLIVLIFGGIVLWNAPAIYSTHTKKYEIRRKYDRLEALAAQKAKKQAEKAARKNRSGGKK